MPDRDPLKTARDCLSTARQRHRNLRLGRYEGRNNGGDTAHLMREASEAMQRLPRDLRGLVWEEHQLAERISENRDAGNLRPELRKRMTKLRQSIRHLSK